MMFVALSSLASSSEVRFQQLCPCFAISPIKQGTKEHSQKYTTELVGVWIYLMPTWYEENKSD